MNTMEGIKGYKVFDPDWTCRGYQYAVGKTYEEEGEPHCCKRGFHFCRDLKDCFSYYSFNPSNKVAEIVALGTIDEDYTDSKCCTNKIYIVREISWEDVLRLVNTGKGNTGYCNSGDRNSGNRNSGNYNSGNRNSGNYNSGNFNRGNRNSGNYNSGNCNSGNCNSGNYNSGNCNSGNYNSGNYNSGDYNKTNFSNGCFNTEEPKIVLFNKLSTWTYRDWLDSDARHILNGIPSTVHEWICSQNMTAEEKSAHPEHETTGGYLKVYEQTESNQTWWDGLKAYEQNEIKSLPNFDADIFEQITGIRVD